MLQEYQSSQIKNYQNQENRGYKQRQLNFIQIVIPVRIIIFHVKDHHLDYLHKLEVRHIQITQGESTKESEIQNRLKN